MKCIEKENILNIVVLRRNNSRNYTLYIIFIGSYIVNAFSVKSGNTSLSIVPLLSCVSELY